MENNTVAHIAMVAWRVIRPSALGEPVTITAADVLIARGLSTLKAQAFLDGFPYEQQSLIRLALVDPAGDSYFEEAILKTYERFGGANQLSSESNSNSDSQASAGPQSESTTVDGGGKLTSS